MPRKYTRKPMEVRFWSRIEREEGCDCWLWTGSLFQKTGYGQFSDNKKTLLAHKWAYEHFVGPVPEGLQLDHLCRNRRCVNPAHLEPISGRLNKLRGNTLNAHFASRPCCSKGHPYNEENTRVTEQGYRQCKVCRRERDRRRRQGVTPTAAQRDKARERWQRWYDQNKSEEREKSRERTRRYRERQKLLHANSSPTAPAAAARSEQSPVG